MGSVRPEVNAELTSWGTTHALELGGGLHWERGGLGSSTPIMTQPCKLKQEEAAVAGKKLF